MEQKELTLEQRAESPDWKQWIPVYGIYKAIADAKANKPSIAQSFEGDHDARFYLSAFYHSTTTIGVIIGAIETLDYLTKQGYLP